MAGKINKKLLQQEVLGSKAAQKLVLESVREEIIKNKKIFINEFEAHPVTQEIRGGETAGNSSGTLGGYGNLFTFIGFNQGSDPISPIINLINKITVSSIAFSKNTFNVKLIIPSKSDFASVSNMPWEGGRSWLFDIEKTISGIGAYLYKQYNKSRSGYGLQSKYNYRSASFRPTQYFNSLYTKFLIRIGARK
jgi:hypothetical protein